MFIYGLSSWHHYYVLLKGYMIPWNNYLDNIFGINELEEKYSSFYKDVFHGTHVSEMVQKLGVDYYEYQGQSPQYRNIYYENFNIEIVIQDGIVKYIQKERPGWTDTEMKHKNK